MIREEYINEVAVLLQGNLERIKKEGKNFEYWLENTAAFTFLENKEVFIQRMLLSIQQIEGVRVEKSSVANGYCFKTRLGEFFYLDIENRTYNINEDFLDAEYWESKCQEIKKEIQSRKEYLKQIEEFNQLTLWQKWRSGMFSTKKREEKKKELEAKIQGSEKRIVIYRKKQKIFFEVHKLVQKLQQLMERYNYTIEYC